MYQVNQREHYHGTYLSVLLNLIACNSDANALREFLDNRKPFTYRYQRLDLVSFVRAITAEYSSKSGRNPVLLDCAHDMTIDKFSSLPQSVVDNLATHSGRKLEVKQRAIDCRNYYRAILAQLDRWRGANPSASTLDEELEVSMMFQRMVMRHFYLSLRECHRSKMPFAKRYSWIVNGRPISLKRPVDISAGEFRKWLEESISDPNPLLPTEGNRIQTLVDKHYSHGSFVPWDEQAASQVSVNTNPSNTTSGTRDSTKSSALATTLAHEKVERIDMMRPAIRELGQDKLYLLVIRIFEDIEDGIVEDTRIANDFGLTKATYSRFAGSDWSKNIDEGNVSVPDLWLNLAEVLSTNSDFMEVAFSAGIVPKLKKVMMARRVSNA